MQFKCKYLLIADQLRNEIHSNIYESCLPREIDLAKHLQVSRGTVNSAIAILAREGLVRRVKGKGTYILGPEKLSLARQAALIMAGTGHFYDPLYQTIIQNLQYHDLFPVCIFLEHKQGKFEEQIITKIRRLLSSPIFGFIIDGNGYWRWPFLQKETSRSIVFIHCFDAPGHPPGHAVLADFEQAAYLATAHLVSLGHKKILQLGLQASFFPIADATHQKNNPWYQRQEGYFRAMNEFGLGDESEAVPARIHGYSEKEEEDRLRGMLCRKQRPTAIVCGSDGDAVQIIRIAAALGLNVPHDLAIIGMYDTPWCQECSVPLTTVSLEEKEIARRAVEIITSPPSSPATIRVKPRLIVRSSCGGLK